MPIRQTTLTPQIAIVSANAVAPTSMAATSATWTITLSYQDIAAANLTAANISVELLRADGTLLTALPDSSFVTNADGTISFTATLSGTYGSYASKDLDIKVKYTDPSSGNVLTQTVDAIFKLPTAVQAVVDQMSAAAKARIYSEANNNYGTNEIFTITSANKDAIVLSGKETTGGGSALNKGTINVNANGMALYGDTNNDGVINSSDDQVSIWEAYHANAENFTTSVKGLHVMEYSINRITDTVGQTYASSLIITSTDGKGVALSVYNEIDSISNPYNVANDNKMINSDFVQIATTQYDDVIDLTGSSFGFNALYSGDGNDIIYIGDTNSYEVKSSKALNYIYTGNGNDIVVIKSSNNTPTYAMFDLTWGGSEYNGDTFYIDNLNTLNVRQTFHTNNLIGTINIKLLEKNDTEFSYKYEISNTVNTTKFTLYTDDIVKSEHFYAGFNKTQAVNDTIDAGFVGDTSAFIAAGYIQL